MNFLRGMLFSSAGVLIEATFFLQTVTTASATSARREIRETQEDAAVAASPSAAPTILNATAVLVEAEEEHASDALNTVTLSVTMIGCLLLAYFVKKFRMYYLPESAGALLTGVLVGGAARLSTDRLRLFEFSPEVFFFILLPPIIFEAGYSLKRKDFFDNIGAITLYAMAGTIISTFVVGGLSFKAAQSGWIRSIDADNPMEALLFGALISAVDPVATLSIMGSAELQCDTLLYSLVFGESVLNDAIAISLFNVFAKYYDPDGPDFTGSQIPRALLQFLFVSGLSVVVGIILGLVVSFLYKHTTLSDYPHLETSLLFLFCYLCYSTAEATGLSGIMALFFQGIVLSHYNSYNLSPTAHVASEQIFTTLATIAETAVFLYMGMSVFTGNQADFDIFFSILALLLCWLGRFLNIFPLSWLANCCRREGTFIPLRMQCVLWFAGLRGAIAFALAMNMPGAHRKTYAATTLFICIFTTVVCGGLTDGMLTRFGMKQKVTVRNDSTAERPMDEDNNFDGVDTDTGGNRQETESDHGTVNAAVSKGSKHKSNEIRPNSNRPESLGNGAGLSATLSPTNRRGPEMRTPRHQRVYKGFKRLWKKFDNSVLKVYFGGSMREMIRDDDLGNYELGFVGSDDDED